MSSNQKGAGPQSSKSANPPGKDGKQDRTRDPQAGQSGPGEQRNPDGNTPPDGEDTLPRAGQGIGKPDSTEAKKSSASARGARPGAEDQRRSDKSTR
jgi:hypothetical protein